ncbi:tRNA (adenosine(37)-N6)-threonylcarbamoyltransferase complex dimerization subunit type 1 TsaB [bacterium]|nr:tRNA (adenosine(37)-N6)-threonylcarbamoyltransferase complex dimerization subunit type 1 TsaB [bacterium]
MISLAIDTSNSSGSIALMKNRELVFSSFFNIKITHSETLMPEIDRALSLCNVDTSDLDAILIAIGPGSFTGLRIGLATAKGISFAHKLPLIPISSLKIVAMNYYKCGKDILVMQDAKMKEVYLAVYSSNLDEIVAPCCISPDDVVKFIEKPTIAVGTGVNPYRKFISDNPNIEINDLEDKNLAKAESMFSVTQIENIHPSFDFDFNSQLEPYYIRKSQAEVNRTQS